MPDTPEKRPSHLDMPRSPVSCSTDSSRRDSLKHLQPEKDSEPPTPNSQSPPFRLTRKRAASIDTESANHPRIGDLALNSASSVGPRASDATREQVCLCQPDPKIPRPRNAFILYRQHYQAQVVTQNPGLANPEISKIIGEKWRETAPEVKNDWKRLAEEEKQRHQRQYPGYRYQPRRAGKPNGIKSLSSSSSDDPVRCPKCNGRYISTPSTPMTPFTPAFASTDSRNDRLLPPFTPGTSSHMEDMSRYSSQGMDTRMDSPRSGPVQPQTHRRGPYPPPQPLHTLREQNEDVNMSPEQKRRRFNEGPQRAYPSPSPISYTGPQTFPRNAPPMSASAYRSQQQFPGQGLFPRSASMAPPQQSPSFQQPRHPYPTRSNTFDESLRLPPLQTQLLSSAPVSTHRPELRPESRESQARSVEAMVMTIPYLNKIKVLSKISGPLPPPGPTSPARDIRGAVIAVEGADHALVSEIGAFLNEALGKEPSLAVKTWTAPPSSSNSPTTPGTDTEMTEDGVENTADNDHDPFVDYLTTISKWHKKSQAIQKHITSTPPSPPIDPGVTKRSSDSAPKRLPVALLPEGFSITTSDHFALRIPINDAYAPVDHWQWMATLWRGILGPDLTVYVKKIRDKEEFESMSGVELRKDCAAIVVRVMEGSKLDEKSARRLAFEVSESVRGAEGAFGRA